MNFDFFCSTLTDQQIVLSAHVFQNIQVEFIPSNADTFIANNTTQSDNCNFSSTTTDINNHISLRLGDIDSNTNSSCHRFVYQINFFGTTALGAILYGTFFNFSDTRWNTNNHFKLR